MRRPLSSIILLTSLALAGCDDEPTPAVRHFHEQLAAEGTLVFLSHEGKWLGFDNDQAIIVRPDGIASYNNYGYANGSDVASYRLKPGGAFAIKARAPFMPPPKSEADFAFDYAMEEENGTLFLRPVGASASDRLRRLPAAEAKQYISDELWLQQQQRDMDAPAGR